MMTFKAMSTSCQLALEAEDVSESNSRPKEKKVPIEVIDSSSILLD